MLCLVVSKLYPRWVPLFRSHHRDKVSIHLVRESVYLTQKLCIWKPCLNNLRLVKNCETDHLQHDLYVDISYKFTLAWVFVSHALKAYTQITINTSINDLVLFTGIQC